jgi:hypothetical protein
VPPKLTATIARFARGLWGRSDPADAERRADAEAIRQTKRYWDDSVALSLADLVHAGETKASGKVQILSLADFRAHIGALWDDYAEHILLIAETTIARMIGKGHTFIPQGDDTWLLLFPGLDPAEAGARADAIGARIGEKLVGAQFAADDPPLPFAGKLDLSGVIKADGSVDMSALKAAVGRARLRQAPPAPPPRKPAARPAEPDRSRINLTLRPSWSADTQVLDTFAIRAAGGVGEDLVSDPNLVFTGPVAAELVAAATRLLAELETRKLRARLVLPLPYALLSSDDAALRKAIVTMPQQPRLLHLRLEVVRVPPTAPVEQLAQIRESLRPLVREVAFVMDPLVPHRQLLALDNIVVVADITFTRVTDDRVLGDALQQLRAQAGARRTALIGARSRSQIRIALDADLTEIGGPALMAELPHLPDRLKVLPRGDLGAG